MRILLFLIALGVGIYFAPQNPKVAEFLDKEPALKNLATTSSGKIKGAADSIKFAPLLNLLEEKNIIPAQFFKTPNSSKSAQILDTKEFTDQLIEQVKDMPKNQAKQIIQNTCQQIIENLD